MSGKDQPCITSIGGDLAGSDAWRPLTLRGGRGPDLMAASGQIPIPMAAHSRRR
jgi:hypothetical protein